MDQDQRCRLQHVPSCRAHRVVGGERYFPDNLTLDCQDRFYIPFYLLRRWGDHVLGVFFRLQLGLWGKGEGEMSRPRYDVHRLENWRFEQRTWLTRLLVQWRTESSITFLLSLVVVVILLCVGWTLLFCSFSPYRMRLQRLSS